MWVSGLVGRLKNGRVGVWVYRVEGEKKEGWRQRLNQKEAFLKSTVIQKAT